MYFFYNLLYIIVFLQLFGQVPADPDYVAGFSESVLDCKDFTNDQVTATFDLSLIEGKDGAPDLVGISGKLKVNKQLDENYELQVTVCKESEVGCDPMFSAQMSIADCLKEKDAPWTPMFEMMNCTSSPIEEGEYAINDLLISLDSMQDCLTHEFCGYYTAQIRLMYDKMDEIACFQCALEVSEVQK